MIPAERRINARLFARAFDVIENRKPILPRARIHATYSKRALTKYSKSRRGVRETIIAAKTAMSLRRGLRFDLSSACDGKRCDLPLSDIYKELEARSKKIGNLKNMKSVDKLT